jgi:hypothetical protein
MSKEQRNALFRALHRLLRPLVRLLLRNGIPFAAFADLAKFVYVEVATNEFSIPGKKQTNSRVATITGLTRKEVLRIGSLDGAESVYTVEKHHRGARVVSGWVRDPRFHDGTGQPAELPFDGHARSFAALVRAYSGDVPPRAILDDLVQVGIASVDKRSRVRLLARGYIPVGGTTEKLGILGHDVAGLINTIDHNIQHGATHPFFQRKVFYDNLPEEALAPLRALVNQKGQPLLEEFDRWVSEHDRDVNPKVEGTGRRGAGIGIYYFEEDPEEESP